MKLAISNIAWEVEYDEKVYNILKDLEIQGIEIAPTRIINEQPYNYLNEINNFSTKLKEKHDLIICSMQSIWYGITDSMFGTNNNRQYLLDYTKKAILFAEEARCSNIVFGCPKNRIIYCDENVKEAVDFFREIGDFAKEHNVVVAIEPNPSIYGTNFLNTTDEAVSFIQKIKKDNIKLNYDMGTVIYNNENLDVLEENIALINHIHISEPNLDKVQVRDIHIELMKRLRRLKYQGFLSVEMKKGSSLQEIIQILKDLKNIWAKLVRDE